MAKLPNNSTCRFNILDAVHRGRRTQKLYIRKYTGRTINESGYKESVFAPRKMFRGNVQWVLTTQYKTLSLDLAKYYIKIYTTEHIETIHRDSNADEIIWNGWVFHPIPSQDWHYQSGWNSFLAIRIKKDDGDA